MRSGRSRVVWALLVAVAAIRPCGAAEREQGVVRIVFAGDVMLDGGPGHAVANGVDPFADFATILRDADLAVCNLECVIAKGGKQVLKPYTFRGMPESVSVLKRYFSAVSVANNHTCDFGLQGFQAQLTLLEKAGLPYFGGGRNRQEARRPWIVEKNSHRVALLGYSDYPPESCEAGPSRPGLAWLREADVVEDIRAAKSRHRAEIVIPFLHWGEEGEPVPRQPQKDLARRLIDAGASAVIGGHPHVTQTVDIHKGRPIVYSLGNFVFDYYPEDPPVWIGWVVRLTFNQSGDVGMETFVLEIDKAGIPHRVPAPQKR